MESPNPNDKSEIEFMEKNDFIYNETGSDDRIMSGASKNNQEKLINFEVDEVLNKIGGFGKWQWFNFILLSLPSAVSGFILLTFSFTGKARSFIFTTFEISNNLKNEIHEINSIIYPF